MSSAGLPFVLIVLAIASSGGVAMAVEDSGGPSPSEFAPSTAPENATVAAFPWRALTVESSTEFTDLGAGKCVVLRDSDNGPEDGSDPLHVYLEGGGERCQSVCSRRSDCGGYSVSKYSNCLIWKVQSSELRGGGQSWGDAHCFTKRDPPASPAPGEVITRTDTGNSEGLECRVGSSRYDESPQPLVNCVGSNSEHVTGRVNYLNRRREDKLSSTSGPMPLLSSCTTEADLNSSGCVCAVMTYELNYDGRTLTRSGYSMCVKKSVEIEGGTTTEKTFWDRENPREYSRSTLTISGTGGGYANPDEKYDAPDPADMDTPTGPLQCQIGTQATGSGAPPSDSSLQSCVNGEATPNAGIVMAANSLAQKMDTGFPTFSACSSETGCVCASMEIAEDGRTVNLNMCVQQKDFGTSTGRTSKEISNALGSATVTLHHCSAHNCNGAGAGSRSGSAEAQEPAIIAGGIIGGVLFVNFVGCAVGAVLFFKKKQQANTSPQSGPAGRSKTPPTSAV